MGQWTTTLGGTVHVYYILAVSMSFLIVIQEGEDYANTEALLAADFEIGHIFCTLLYMVITL